VRHGKAGWKNTDQSDFERTLNHRGERDVDFLSKLLADKIETPDLFLSSPAVRAKITSMTFADEFGLDYDAIQFVDGLYDRGGKFIINLLKELDNKYNSVILFGHNPDMTSLSSYFSGEYFENVPTSGIVAIEFDFDDWKQIENTNGKLLFFEYPKLYF
jgi:phosphohistidine phosphatase